MQDIDFDEIDRAVSSVTSTPSTPAPITDVSAAVPVSVTVTPPVVVAHPVQTSSPAARRSTGRFMDVVHASSDMRPPRTDDVSPVAPRPEAPATPPASTFQWPDPIELHEQATAPVPEAPKDIDAVIVPAVEPISPLESPFLTDAKVEKRPLGAFSETATEAPIVTQAETIEEAEALNADLLSLADHGEDTTPIAPEPALPTEEMAIPTGPVSITQQYTEKASTAPEASGSIFDTESYHQPVSPPNKRRSTLFVVLWIVGLVVVGGGIGAAVYFFALPALT